MESAAAIILLILKILADVQASRSALGEAKLLRETLSGKLDNHEERITALEKVK